MLYSLPMGHSVREVVVDETCGRWNLGDLFGGADAGQLDQTILELEQTVARLESSRSCLSSEISTGSFLQLLDAYETMTRLQRRPAAYAFLRFAADTQDQAALSLQNRVNQLLANSDNRVVFFELWFKALPAESAARLVGASGDRRYFLESWRRLKPFTLSEPEEKVITLKDVNGIEALVTLYDIITNAFSFTLEVDGDR